MRAVFELVLTHLAGYEDGEGGGEAGFRGEVREETRGDLDGVGGHGFGEGCVWGWVS